MAQQVQQRVTFRVIGIVAVVYTRSAGYNGFYTFRNVWWKTPCQGLGTRLVYFLDLVEVIESIDLSLLSIQIQSFRFYLKSWVLVEFRSFYPELGRGSLGLQGLEWNMVTGQNIPCEKHKKMYVFWPELLPKMKKIPSSSVILLDNLWCFTICCTGSVDSGNSEIVNLLPNDCAASFRPAEPSNAAICDNAILSSTAGKYGYLEFIMRQQVWIVNVQLPSGQ